MRTTMRGRVVARQNNSWRDKASYVQINIYNTSLKDLRQHGINIKHMLKRIDRRSVVVDVPIPSLGSRKLTTLSRRLPKKPLYEVLLSATQTKQELQMDMTALEVSSMVESPISPVSNAIKGNSNLRAGEIFHDCLEDSCDSVHREEVCDRRLLPELSSKEMMGATSLESCDKDSKQRRGYSRYERAAANNAFPIIKPSEARPTATFRESSKKLCDPPADRHSSIPANTTNNFERERYTTKLAKEAVRSTSNVMPTHGVAKVALGMLQNPGTMVRSSMHKEANTSEREDENEVDKMLNSNPAANQVKKLMTSKPITVQNASDDAMDWAPSANLGEKCAGKNTVNAVSSNKCKSLSSNHGTGGEKKVVNGNISDCEGNAAKRKGLCTKVEECSKLYECKIKGCGQNIRWRPRYGKSRLIDHVRIHWGKRTKKCKLCDFKASHVGKVLSHHKVSHASEKYEMAESLETQEDLDQLLLLWKECFPDWFSQKSL